MEMIKDMFKAWLEVSTQPMSNDWMGWVMLVLVWAMNIMVIYMIYIFCIRPILYKKKYSEIQFDDGKVTDKQYHTYTTTTYIRSGKTSTPITTTHHNYYVYLKGEVINQRVDAQNWYNSFTSGEEVKMEYREVYETLRFSPNEDWKFVRNDILSLESRSK